MQSSAKPPQAPGASINLIQITPGDSTEVLIQLANKSFLLKLPTAEPGNIPHSSAGNISQASAGNISQASAGNIPQASAGNIHQASAGNIHQSSAGNIHHSSAGDISQASAGNISQASAGNIHQASAGNIHQSSAGNIHHSSAGDISQASAGNISQASAGDIPQASAGNIHQASAGNIHQSSAGNIHQASAGNIHQASAGNIHQASADDLLVPKVEEDEGPRHSSEVDNTPPPPHPGSITPKKVQCSVCKKDVNVNSFDEHMNLHTGEQPHGCDVCGKQFSLLTSLTIHKQTHTLNTYKCNICGAIYKLRALYLKHLNKHKLESMYQAIVPSNNTEEPEEELDFANQNKNVTPDGQLKCDICSVEMLTPHLLQKHKLLHNSSHKKTKTLKKRPVAVVNVKDLPSPKKSKKIINKKQCRFCGKHLTQSNSLLEHERIHTGERPFQCKDCGKGFNAISNYRRHLRTHTGEKPYKCLICSKRYTQSSSLNCHLKSTDCGKGLVEGDKGYIYQKKRAHYKCEICDETFKSLFVFNEHEKTHKEKKACESSDGPQLDTEMTSSHDSDVEYKFSEDPDFQSQSEYPEFEEFEEKPSINVEVEKPVSKVVKNASASLEALEEKSVGEEDEPVEVWQNIQNVADQVEIETENSAENCQTEMLHESQHLQDEYKKPDSGQLHKCETCGIEMLTPDLLQKHKLLHKASHKNTKISVKSLANELAQNTNEVGPQTSYKCRYCGRSFPRSSDCTKHENAQGGEKGRRCCYCGECSKGAFCSNQCSKRQKARNVVLNKDKYRRFKCDVCGKKFLTSSHRSRHARAHFGIRPYKCEICGNAYTQSGSLKIHMITHATESSVVDLGLKKIEVKSNDQNISGTSAGMMKYNVVGREKIETKSNDQNSCSMPVVMMKSVVELEKIKKDGGRYRCMVCGIRFTDANNLSQHIKLHSGSRAHKCDTCGKGFTHASNLRRHKRTHTGERPYQCEVCGTRFTQSGTKKLHKKIQHGIIEPTTVMYDVSPARTPNVRDVDIKQFKNSPKRMKKHFECSKCGDDFTGWRAFKLHKRSHMDDAEEDEEEDHTEAENQFDIIVESSEGQHQEEIAIFSQNEKQADNSGSSYTCNEVSQEVTKSKHGKTDIYDKGEQTDSATEDYIDVTSSVNQVQENTQNQLDKPSSLIIPGMLRHSEKKKEYRKKQHEKKSYPCGTCGKTVVGFKSFKLHKEAHFKTRTAGNEMSTKREHSCILKSKKLSTDPKLYGGRGKTCPHCKGTLSSAEALREHLRLHTGERPHKCEYCQKRFKFASNFRRHLRTHTGHRPYSCAICKNTFTQSHSVKDHLNSVHNYFGPMTNKIISSFARQKNGSSSASTEAKSNERFKCNMCEKVFSMKNSLKSHMKAHENKEEPDPLPLEEKNKEPDSLESDVPGFPIDKIYKCTVCNGEFSNSHTLVRHKCSLGMKHSLKTHQKAHEKKKEPDPLPLEEKNKKPDSLESDVPGFPIDRIFKCTVCNGEFSNSHTLVGHKCSLSMKHSLKTHQKAHEKKKEPDPLPLEEKNKKPDSLESDVPGFPIDRIFKCTVCNGEFSNSHTLVRHKCSLPDYTKTMATGIPRTLHESKQASDSGKKFYCNLCSCVFHTGDLLTRHNSEYHNANMDMKKFFCKICGLSYKYRVCYERHVQKHNTGGQAAVTENKRWVDPEKPYVCEICFKGVPTEIGLMMHKKIHAKALIYGCKVCSRKFTTSDQLRLHTNTDHLQASGNKCDVCGKIFLYARELKEHKESHDDEASTSGFQREFMAVEDNSPPVITAIVKNIHNKRIPHAPTGSSGAWELETSDAMIENDDMMDTKNVVIPAMTLSKENEEVNETRHVENSLTIKSEDTHECESWGKNLVEDSHPCKRARVDSNDEVIAEAASEQAVRHNVLESPTQEMILESEDVAKSVIPEEEYVDECQTCREGITRPSSLNEHEMAHTHLYACDNCEKTFITATGLKLHKHAHKRQCQKCGQRFKRTSFLQRHIKKVHSGKKKFNISLVTPQVKSTTEEVFTMANTEIASNIYDPKADTISHVVTAQSHELIEHTEGNSVIINENNQTKDNVTAIAMIPKKERLHECETCGRCFSQLGILNDHRRAHTEELPFQCRICGKQFHEQDELSEHVCSISHLIDLP